MADTEKQSFDTPTMQADQANLILHCTTRIAAPASLVFRVLRNTETWKDWNKFVPKVHITYQPPDDDLATAAEIEELVRNTSIAGSYDSDLTDGMQGGGSFKQRLSENGERPSTPPLRLRMNSQASRGSERSGSEDASATSPPTNGSALLAVSGGTGENEERKMSAAQKYEAAQAERKASVASGNSLPATHNVLKEAPPATVIALGPVARKKSLAPSESSLGRRASKTPSLQKEMRQRQASLNLLYGEPPVRMQLNTRMTFWMRMNPHNNWEFKQMHCVVTEVSRPDDPITDGMNITQLTRSKTHTLNRLSVYRLVWGLDNTMSSVANMKNGSAYPKSLLITERVHEIRPIVLGDGSEECEMKVWELQKGTIAKMTKKKQEGFLQGQLANSGNGLKDFCEAMVGKVDRRDFSVVVDEEDRPVAFTF